jgi:hypothetical protein
MQRSGGSGLGWLLKLAVIFIGIYVIWRVGSAIDPGGLFSQTINPALCTYISVGCPPTEIAGQPVTVQAAPSTDVPTTIAQSGSWLTRVLNEIGRVFVGIFGALANIFVGLTGVVAVQGNQVDSNLSTVTPNWMWWILGIIIAWQLWKNRYALQGSIADTFKGNFNLGFIAFLLGVLGLPLYAVVVQNQKDGAASAAWHSTPNWFDAAGRALIASGPALFAVATVALGLFILFSALTKMVPLSPHLGSVILWVGILFLLLSIFSVPFRTWFGSWTGGLGAVLGAGISDVVTSTGYTPGTFVPPAIIALAIPFLYNLSRRFKRGEFNR